MRSVLVLCILVIMLGGCSAFREKESGEPGPKQLFDQGKTALDDNDYELAIENFEKLESRYPFRIYAQQAKLDIAYAYYKFGEPESAIATADRFIKTYPRHPNVDYAYYIRGLASFTPEKGFFDRLFNLDPTTRDPRSAEKSYQYFSELIEKFPDSKYAADAVQRMIHLENYLARHELGVANYYMKRGAFVAAVNRAQYIIENYPRSTSVPGALVIMEDAYQRLGLEELSNDTARVLQLNQPDRPSSGEDDGAKKNAHG